MIFSSKCTVKRLLFGFCPDLMWNSQRFRDPLAGIGVGSLASKGEKGKEARGHPILQTLL